MEHLVLSWGGRVWWTDRRQPRGRMVADVLPDGRGSPPGLMFLKADCGANAGVVTFRAAAVRVVDSRGPQVELVGPG